MKSLGADPLTDILFSGPHIRVLGYCQVYQYPTDGQMEGGTSLLPTDGQVSIA